MKSVANLFQVGWGKSEDDAPHVNIPRQIFLTALNDSFCYTHDHDIAKISSLRTFCAGGDGAGPCTGDSGLTRNENKD